jgi:sugar phosphate isomerase/epimerase
MTSVISINEKFQTVEPKKLMDKIINSTSVRGIEVCVDPDNEFMMDYMDQLVNLCKDNNILFQIHGDSSLSLDKQKKYLDKLQRYSDYLGYPINVVMHSLTRDTTEEEIYATQEYLKEIIEYVDLDRITISVENLNDADGIIRLDKHEMEPVLCNDERLYMTYDIGHDIADYGKITDLNPLFISRISNVHIHATTKKFEDGYDHKPIDDEMDIFQEVLKGILYLKHLDYKGPIVFEYDLYLCDGETIEEKIDNYIHSIDDTSEHFI